jgi:pimeloyl-ACP methyl ester carboxylesterase
MPTFTHDGLRLHYDVIGSGPPVLCVHGATGTGAYEWSELATALADRYRFITPDLRGHGNSEYRGGKTGINEVNDDLLALLQHEHVARPHVLAFSFGSEAALELEMTHPGTSASLILLSPGLADPKAVLPTRQQLEAGWPRALRHLHTEQHGEAHWLDLAVELCERSGRRPKTDLAAVAAIGCPILLIVGNNDDRRRVRYARTIEEVHRESRLVVIDGARHSVHKECRDHVATVILEFLDELT